MSVGTWSVGSRELDPGPILVGGRKADPEPRLGLRPGGAEFNAWKSSVRVTVSVSPSPGKERGFYLSVLTYHVATTARGSTDRVSLSAPGS